MKPKDPGPCPDGSGGWGGVCGRLGPPAPPHNPPLRPTPVTYIKVEMASWSWPTGDDGNQPEK